MESSIPLEGISALVKIPVYYLKGALQKGSIQLITDFLIPYLRFKKDIKHLERGTVIFLGNGISVIRGFPRIRRALILSAALRRYFKTEVAVEEKMNGYNVRLAAIQNGIVALTRGGFVCPFTTEKAKELLHLQAFFKDHPNLTICAEMVGEESPYVVHKYEEADHFGIFIFDVREHLTNKPLPLLERRKLIEEYNLPQVRFFGIYYVNEASSKIMEIIKQLNVTNREGVVIKDPKMEAPPIKYTCSRSNAGDLEYAFRFFFDYGKDFFFSRVIREGFQAVELREKEPELERRALQLGKGILYPMVNSIQKVASGEEVVEPVVIKVREVETAENFIKHLRRMGVIAAIDRVEVQKDGTSLVHLKRMHQATTNKIKAFLVGMGGLD
ncbi:MAG: RNA ligase [Euryarchaeota archaeon]|nr:RNA ligase [Euryarchaeota archaeon]